MSDSGVYKLISNKEKEISVTLLVKGKIMFY